MAPGDGSEGGGAPRSNDRGDRGGNYGGGNDRGDRGGNYGNDRGGDRGGNRNQGGNFGGGDPIARAASSQAPGFDSSNDDDDLPF